jgi:hypothetical protein
MEKTIKKSNVIEVDKIIEKEIFSWFDRIDLVLEKLGPYVIALFTMYLAIHLVVARLR